MADNLGYTPGTGATVRSTDTGSGHIQHVYANPQTLDAAFNTTAVAAVVAGVRMDADTSPVSATGDVHPFVFNEQGRLKTAGAAAQFAAVTGAITASAQSVSADVSQASNIAFYVTGTFAGHNVTFEASLDGTNWFSVQAIRTNANTIETTSGALSAAPAYAWEASVNAYTNFRVRATAHTSGTANWRIMLGSYATEPIPGAQVSASQVVDTELPAAAALSDATANPTAPMVGAGQMVFNGTTFERQRGHWNTTTGDTGAKTATFNGATQTNTNARNVHILVNVGTVSGTTPSMAVKVQQSDDSGTTWFDIPGGSIGPITASGVFGLTVSPSIATATAFAQWPLGRTWRLVYTITGTTPSFTLTNVQVAYTI